MFTNTCMFIIIVLLILQSNKIFFDAWTPDSLMARRITERLLNLEQNNCLVYLVCENW